MITEADKRAVLDGELADLALYQKLRENSQGTLSTILDEFIQTETRHAGYWRELFHLKDSELSFAGRFRNLCIRLAVVVFGEKAAYLLLEAVETHGIKKYLELWKNADDEKLRQGLRTILTEEFSHEDEVATQGERKIDPTLIRNTFLGFNDGSVEILGAVSGLAAALNSPNLVAAAALTVSIAGSISMAAGAFLSTHSENELAETDHAKSQFLNPQKKAESPDTNSPWKASAIVGIAYLIGAAVPVLPFFLGASSPLWSIILSGSLIIIVSALLAFLSGMNLKRRVLLNTAIVITAVLISYGIGSIADNLLGTHLS